MSKKTTGKNFNIPNPSITYWERIEADDSKEAKKLDYRSSFSTLGRKEIPLRDVFEYMHKHWFEFMYKPDIRDMIKAQPEIITNSNIIDKFMEKFNEAIKDLERLHR